MDRYESSEDYLETIYMLHLEHKTVRAIDVATKMNFSKASVSIAMKKLKARNLITVNSESGNIELTERGNQIAQEMFERHNFLYTLLVKLGVPEEIAIKDACKMMREISVIKKNISKIEF